MKNSQCFINLAFTVPFYLFRLRKELFTALITCKAIKTDNKSNYWLSFSFFFCSLYSAPWMLGFAGWYMTLSRYFILHPFQHLLWIGPIIIFLHQSLLNPLFKFSKKKHSFNARLLYLLYIIAIWIYDQFIFW
jgi:hypothetical protein